MSKKKIIKTKDRFVYHSHIINIKGNLYRLKDKIIKEKENIA